MEHDAFGRLKLFFCKAERLYQVPGDCFSFAVLIGREYYFIRLFCSSLQFFYHWLRSPGNNILRFESVCGVHTEFVGRKVANMPIT